jgi:hypothetical protein
MRDESAAPARFQSVKPAGRHSSGRSDKLARHVNDTHPFNKNQIMNCVFSSFFSTTLFTQASVRIAFRSSKAQ